MRCFRISIDSIALTGSQSRGSVLPAGGGYRVSRAGPGNLFGNAHRQPADSPYWIGCSRQTIVGVDPQSSSCKGSAWLGFWVDHIWLGGDELLNRELFLHIDELRYVADRWRMDYNHYRPHSSLGYMSPAAFAGMVAKNPSGPQPGKLPPCCPNLPGCPNDFLPASIGKNSHSDWY